MKLHIFIVSMLITLTLGASSCSKDTGTTAKPESKTTAEVEKAGHAPSNAKPGSYEDWCGEHQVPESQCTRCNPALIPAFKATQDWCEEHSLPESQCLKCNPGIKIVRPPKAGG
jgi:hypothetical protein